MGNAFKDIDAVASILVGRLEDPVVASNEVAVWHHVLGRRFSHQHCPDARPFLNGDVVQPVVDFCETQEVKVSCVNI